MTPQGGFSFVDQVRSEKFEIDDFSAVKIQNTKYLKIVKADSTYLEYISIHGGDVKPPKTEPVQNYRVSQDTLYIDKLQQASNGSFMLKVRNLSQILVMDESEVIIKNQTMDTLVFKSPLHQLQIIGLDSGSVDYRSGQLFLKGTIGELTGSLKDRAWLSIPSKIGKINLEKGEKATVFVE
ncbi:hypothetical protein [Algoriphagus formosus]|uniref:hypothetical protein n=1 Tax=Algoriphagus formosus TaxID=2007308 RepID=UPI0012FD287C|nr:hypothetical protein [Algoriphagus formosus]